MDGRILIAIAFGQVFHSTGYEGGCEEAVVSDLGLPAVDDHEFLPKPGRCVHEMPAVRAEGETPREDLIVFGTFSAVKDDEVLGGLLE